LRTHGCQWDENTCTNAAAGGRLKVLQWARANGCPWDKGSCSYAARNGDLDMLQ